MKIGQKIKFENSRNKKAYSIITKVEKTKAYTKVSLSNGEAVIFYNAA